MAEKEETVEDKVKKAIEAERIRISKLLYDRMPGLTSDYKQLMKYTGGLMSASMTVAYNRALRDVVRLIITETENKGDDSVESNNPESDSAKTAG